MRLTSAAADVHTLSVSVLCLNCSKGKPAEVELIHQTHPGHRRCKRCGCEIRIHSWLKARRNCSGATRSLRPSSKQTLPTPQLAEACHEVSHRFFGRLKSD